MAVKNAHRKVHDSSKLKCVLCFRTLETFSGPPKPALFELGILNVVC